MLKEFQKLLKKENIDYYIVPTDDDHQSESVGEYYQTRAYLSGFTGSAGTLLVTQDEAFLWTDGRYFIQAKQELKDGIKLMKMAQAGVPTIHEYLVDHLQENDVVGFDGQVMNIQFIMQLKEQAKKPFRIKSVDLFDQFWKERPSRSCQKAYLYDIQYHGKATSEKIKMVQDYMRKVDCQNHLITTLDDIAWIFNIRGHDVSNATTVLAFALITLDECYLYLQKDAFDQELVDTFAKDHVIIKEYSDVYKDVSTLEGSLLLNTPQINYDLFQHIQCDIVDEMNPSQFFKAIKNDVEIENTRNAHLKDGVAVTKFMYWLKKNYGKVPMDEISVTEKLVSFRKEQPLFDEPSFSTICAFNENAALMHYHATEENHSVIEGNGMLLIDSGVQYLDGTTDITRTFALGQLSDIQKKHFTMVLKGMLALQYASFLHGCTGQNLDILARTPMWKADIDYQCGTGHGVGHFLNVHEGPHGIRPIPKFQNENTIFEAGMVVTDEPGIYLENQYGIRLENELLCVKGTENEYGQFLHFDVLTLAPIDMDAVNMDLLTFEEKEMLSHYHKLVFEKVSPFLTTEEKEWLQDHIKETV